MRPGAQKTVGPASRPDRCQNLQLPQSLRERCWGRQVEKKGLTLVGQLGYL